MVLKMRATKMPMSVQIHGASGGKNDLHVPEIAPAQPVNPISLLSEPQSDFLHTGHGKKHSFSPLQCLTHAISSQTLISLFFVFPGFSCLHWSQCDAFRTTLHIPQSASLPHLQLSAQNVWLQNTIFVFESSARFANVNAFDIASCVVKSTNTQKTASVISLWCVSFSIFVFSHWQNKFPLNQFVRVDQWTHILKMPLATILGPKILQKLHLGDPTTLCPQHSFEQQLQWHDSVNQWHCHKPQWIHGQTFCFDKAPQAKKQSTQQPTAIGNPEK